MTSGGVEGAQAVEIFLLEAAHLRKGIIVLKAESFLQSKLVGRCRGTQPFHFICMRTLASVSLRGVKPVNE